MNNYLLPFRERRRLHDRALRAQKRDMSEVCGLVIADEENRLELLFLKNLATKSGSFLIQWRSVTYARKFLAGTNKRVFGVFHSHVCAGPKPGTRDMSNIPMTLLQLIYDVCGREVKLWKIRSRKGQRFARELPLVQE